MNKHILNYKTFEVKHIQPEDNEEVIEENPDGYYVHKIVYPNGVIEYYAIYDNGVIKDRGRPFLPVVDTSLFMVTTGGIFLRGYSNDFFPWRINIPFSVISEEEKKGLLNGEIEITCWNIEGIDQGRVRHYTLDELSRILRINKEEFNFVRN